MINLHKHYMLFIVILCLPVFSHGEDIGKSSFDAGEFQKAAEYYQQLLNEENIPEASYNLGSALYKNGDFEQSVDAFERSLAMQQEPKKAQAMYNLGNALVNAGKLKESLPFYERSLELEPGDLDAKYNLELVKRMLQQQEQQQNQQGQDQQQNEQENQQNQDQQDSENDQDQQQEQNQDQQNQQNQDQEEQQDQEDQQNEQQNQQDQQNQEQQEQQGSTAENQPKSLEEQEAEQILNALRLNQDQVMKAQIRKKLKNTKTEKDW